MGLVSLAANILFAGLRSEALLQCARGVSARLDQLDERLKAAQPLVGFFGDIIDDALHLFFAQIASLKQKRLVGASDQLDLFAIVQIKNLLHRGRRVEAKLPNRCSLNGFYNYYAVPTNFRALNSFYWHIMRYWQHCLRRRSQRHRLTCQRMMRIAAHWLPNPKLRHPCPDWRFDVMTRGRSPVR